MKKYINRYLLNDVNGFDVFEDIIVILKYEKEGTLIEFYDSNLKIIHSFVADIIYGGYKSGNQFVSFKRVGNLEIFNLDNFNKKTIEAKVSFIELKDDELFFYDLMNNSYCRYSSNEGLQILFKISDEDFFKYENFAAPELGIGYCKWSEIVFFNIKTGDLLWKFDVVNYFDTPSDIYGGRVLAVGDRLVFFAHTEDWKQYATFVLDANTGEIINNPAETIFGGKLYLFDNYIWQKKDKGFAKMNPFTLEITHYDLSQELPTEIIDNHTMAYCDGVIAVSAKPEKGSIRSLVLLFDVQAEKIIWRKEILHNENKPATNKNRRQIDQIKMNDKYLAVSTTGYSLYVFEKEEK